MPEGDTILRAARRVGGAHVGKEILAIEAPQPRHTHITLHSHLPMGGKWAVYRSGERWRRSPRRAWLVVHTADHEIVQFDGPGLELMTESRTHFDQRLAALGPDILGAIFDEAAFLRRLREDDPTRGLGDALLDQRNVAGIGNIWKSESCFAAEILAWRRLNEVTDDEAARIVRCARPLMQASAEHGGTRNRPRVYERAGRPCPRCGTLVRARGQGDDNRTTFWCPGCQR